MGRGHPERSFEGFNRGMFAVNEGIDMVAAKPVAQAYDLCRAAAGQGRASAISSATSPTFSQSALNNALQGKLARCRESTSAVC
jgi:ABC-type transporter lipoprotein component MlaA